MRPTLESATEATTEAMADDAEVPIQDGVEPGIEEGADEVPELAGEATLQEPEPYVPSPPRLEDVEAPSEPKPLRTADSRQEVARVDAELLENLLNAAGEISIYHSRLNQQVSSFEFHVEEFEATVQRLREQHLPGLEVGLGQAQLAGAQELTARELRRHDLADREQRELEAIDEHGQPKEYQNRTTRQRESIVERLLQNEVLEESDHDNDRRKITNTPGDVLP